MSLEGKSPDEIEALATLAGSLLNNSTTRVAFQKLLKEANPHISVPELEAEERLAATVQPHVERIQRLEEERQRDAAQSAANELYGNLRDSGACRNKDEFNELVKYASENGFMTSEAGLKKAAQSRSMEQEAATPTPAQIGAAGVFNKGELKDWMKDPKARAYAEADKALADLRKGGGFRH